ncbi:hypothetical protein [Nocardia terpenica]|uniref:Uncharacterized protein n=1 Tax=Nocardia terpenica TaxID=455432 RepID=A0A6G9Z805_9NOCA|nr:hypothetical protein [Nocardia terpenica]QIS21648.1 hypothetical protein F6W96_28230 [Nocardia terpenica]
MNVVTRLAAATTGLLAVPVVCAGFVSAAPVLVEDAPVTLISIPGGAAHPESIAGYVSSVSAGQQDFDPGPYSSLEECEQARERYYDPSQLECVPV